jgi:hypothetical protein
MRRLDKYFISLSDGRKGKMKRSTVLGTVLTLSLTVIIAVAAITPALAGSDQGHTHDTEPVKIYGKGGTVVLQLPEGIPSHPTTLKISVGDFDKRSTYGAYDTLFVSLWIPAYNGFMTVACIETNVVHSNSLSRPFFTSSFVWSPPLFPNDFQVADNELEVWKHGNIITATLTKSIDISLPFNLLPAPFTAWGDLSFTLPPMTLEFVEIPASPKYIDVAYGVPSGWSIELTEWDKAAWVSVMIPQWLGMEPITDTGYVFLNRISAFTAP